MAKRFGPTIDLLDRSQNGIPNLAQFFVVQALKSIGDYPAQTINLTNGRKINFLVRYTTKHREKEKLFWVNKDLTVMEDGKYLNRKMKKAWTINRIVYESPIQCGKNLFFYSGTGKCDENNLLPPQILTDLNEFDDSVYEYCTINLKMKEGFTMPATSSTTKKDKIDVKQVKKLLQQLSVAIESIENTINNTLIICKELVLIMNFQTVGRVINSLKDLENTEDPEITDETHNLQFTLLVNCMVLMYAMQECANFSTKYTDIKISEVAAEVKQFVEFNLSHVDVKTSTPLIPTLKVDASDTCITVPNVRDVTPVESRFLDIFDVQVKTYYTKLVADERYIASSWYTQLYQWVCNLPQLTVVLVEDLTRNLLRFVFYALRHPMIITGASISDEYELLNRAQQLLKVIGDGIDDFLANNFSTISTIVHVPFSFFAHPVDTLIAGINAVTNLFNQCADFLKSVDKWKVMREPFVLLWGKFKKEPGRNLVNIVCSLSAIVLGAYSTFASKAHATQSFKITAVPPAHSLFGPMATLGIPANSAVSALAKAKTASDEIKPAISDIAVKDSIDCIIQTIGLCDPITDQETIKSLQTEIWRLQALFTTSEYKGVDYYAQYLEDTHSCLNDCLEIALIDCDADDSLRDLKNEIERIAALQTLYKKPTVSASSEISFTRSAPVAPAPLTAFFASGATDVDTTLTSSASDAYEPPVPAYY